MLNVLAYVSGPYRDKRGVRFVEENIRKAEAVAVELWRLGLATICPHANTRHFDGVVPCDEFIAGDLVMVSRCDLIVMIEGWENSEGAKAELEHAKQSGVDVAYWPQDREKLERTVQHCKKIEERHKQRMQEVLKVVQEVGDKLGIKSKAA